MTLPSRLFMEHSMLFHLRLIAECGMRSIVMVKVEENLFTDKRLIRDYEDLRDVVNDGHVWIGFSKAAFEEYLKVRGRKRIPDRTLARRVKILHAVRTK